MIGNKNKKGGNRDEIKSDYKFMDFVNRIGKL